MTEAITDPEGFKSYVAANAEPLRQYGAKFLVRGGKSETTEGKFRSRVVVIEFKDYATALTCYRSPEYQKAIKLRMDTSNADFLIIEGYDDAQPVRAADNAAKVE